MGRKKNSLKTLRIPFEEERFCATYEKDFVQVTFF